jgi:hypothetical protein
MTTFPDTRRNVDICEVTHYEPIVDEKFPVEAIGSESGKVWVFKLKMKVYTKLFALNKGSAYIATNGMYIDPDSETPTSKYVVNATDFLGNPVGNLDYCFISFPTNIDDASDGAYYGTLIDSDHPNIDDVPHRTISEYDWSYAGCFTLNGNDLSSPPKGVDWPTSVEVLPAGAAWAKDGQICDRVIEVQQSKSVYPTQIGEALSDLNAWMDKTSTLKSIYSPETDISWRGLVNVENAEDTEDTNVPASMRNSLVNLVRKILHLDDNYFEVALSQVKTFLQRIGDELNNGLNATTKKEIGNLCKFEYKVSNI